MPDLGSYLQLIPSWNSDKPRFVSTLAALLQPMVDAQAMLAKLTADFDIDTAVGVQLDMVGQWVGRSRWVWMPIEGVFFSFNLPEQHVGFNEGVWARPYDSLYGQVAMDDDDYRAVLKFKIVLNGWDSTVPSMAYELVALVPGFGLIDLGDQATGLMSMLAILTKTFNPIFVAALQQTPFFKPSGVRLTFIEATVPDTPVFGFNIETDRVAGFNVGSWGRVLPTV